MVVSAASAHFCMMMGTRAGLIVVGVLLQVAGGWAQTVPFYSCPDTGICYMNPFVSRNNINQSAAIEICGSGSINSASITVTGLELPTFVSAAEFSQFVTILQENAGSSSPKLWIGYFDNKNAYTDSAATWASWMGGFTRTEWSAGKLANDDPCHDIDIDTSKIADCSCSVSAVVFWCSVKNCELAMNASHFGLTIDPGLTGTTSTGCTVYQVDELTTPAPPTAAPTTAITVTEDLVLYTDYTGPPIFPLNTVEHAAARALQTLGCTWLLVILGFSIICTLAFRIFDTERMIQLLEEITLFLSHCLILVLREATWSRTVCKVTASTLHFCYLSHFVLISLEALHAFAYKTNIAGRKGLCNLPVYVLLGFGVPLIVVVPTVAAAHENYVADFSCWVNYANGIYSASVFPIVVFVVLTIIFAESADIYQGPRLPMQKREKRLWALLSTSSVATLALLSLAAFIVGSYAVHRQNIALYPVVFVLNILLGVFFWMSHTMTNKKVQQFVQKTMAKCCKRGRR